MINNSKLRNLLMTLSGLALIIFGFYLISQNVSGNYTGPLFGLGCGILVNGLSGFCNKNSKLQKLYNVSLNDERNQLLRYKTISEVHRVDKFILCGITMLAAILNLPLWIILSLSGLLLLDLFLFIIIYNKNNKLM